MVYVTYLQLVSFIETGERVGKGLASFVNPAERASLMVLRPSSLAQIARPISGSTSATAIATPDGSLTYGQLDDCIETARASLSAAQVEVGDRLLLALPSSPAFVCYYLAAQRAGVVVMPLNPLLGAAEVNHIVSTMRPRAIVLPPSGKNSPAAHALEALIQEGAAAVALRSPDFLQLTGSSSPLVSPPDLVSVNEEEALILFTSGTSGTPKGVSHCGTSVLANALHSSELLGFRRDDVLLSPLPLSHTFGQSVIMLGGLLAGAEIAIPGSTAPTDILSWMNAREATVVAGVPTTFAALVELGRADPSGTRHAARRLRLALAGGAPLPPATASAFEEVFGIPIHQGYGMTEVACCISFEAAAEPPSGGVGRVFPMLEYKIVGAKGDASPEGELLLSGPNIFRGYYIDGSFVRRKDTAWFPTGDLVREDAANLISVYDRKKDLIIRNGYNVYPSEVEATLCLHPDVIACAVLGVDDPIVGQEVVAFVALRAGATATPANLASWCRERIALYKYPRKIALLPSLPMNASGKVLKRELAVDLPKLVKPVGDL